MKIYDINDFEKVVLTHNHCGDSDRFYAYIYNGNDFKPINNFFPSNYLDLFFKEPLKLIGRVWSLNSKIWHFFGLINHFILYNQSIFCDLINKKN